VESRPGKEKRMSEEREPGQRAYETWVAEMDRQHVGCDAWSDQDGAEQAAWAAVEAQFRDEAVRSS
jgi:hypothetical protein